MKKNSRLIAVFILLAAVVAYFYFNRSNNTLKGELRDFAFKDTSAITRIFLADKSGKQVVLDRKSNDEWVLNSKHWARPDAINTLLKTIHDLEVRSPIGKKAYNSTIKSIAAKGIKVELYTKSGKVKTYYVGGPTQDQYGTFMYMENSTVPFIIHIPGFNGYLTPRYITNKTDWMVKNVFRLKSGDLKSLEVVDRQRPGFAFRIDADPATGDFLIYDGFGNSVEGVSQDKVIDYLGRYSMLNFESLEKTLAPNQRDSIRAVLPFRSIAMVKTNGDSSRIDLWRRPITSQTPNKTLEDGTPFPFDIDRMTATLNRDTSLVVVQYFSFERLFLKPSDFQIVTVRK
ncbi:MAG: DUF4340 domain-containing protein [Bacteroidota bacterium]|jgi:hypothetical protein